MFDCQYIFTKVVFRIDYLLCWLSIKRRNCIYYIIYPQERRTATAPPTCAKVSVATNTCTGEATSSAGAHTCSLQGMQVLLLCEPCFCGSVLVHIVNMMISETRQGMESTISKLGYIYWSDTYYTYINIRIRSIQWLTFWSLTWCQHRVSSTLPPPHRRPSTDTGFHKGFHKQSSVRIDTRMLHIVCWNWLYYSLLKCANVCYSVRDTMLVI